jgi:hypothetical protein
MSLMKSSTTRQKARLPIALASLNNGHSSYLRACYAGVRSSSKPSFVSAKPLCLWSTVWRSSLVTNLSNTTPRRVLTAEVEAHAVISRCHVAATTLARNLIWPCNSFMLSRCTSFFSVSPSLALKPVRRKLNLHSSYWGASAKVSTTRLTT